MGVCDEREKKKDTSQKMNEKMYVSRKILGKKECAAKKIYIKMSSCDNTLQLMND